MWSECYVLNIWYENLWALSYRQIRERDHFSQFVTEDFNQYIKRKKRMGVHGNHLELQAVSEIYSSPIEIYAVNDSKNGLCVVSNLADPLNIFQGSYEANAVPIRLSYHYGLHYNSVRDLSTPRTFRPRPDIVCCHNTLPSDGYFRVWLAKTWSGCY